MENPSLPKTPFLRLSHLPTWLLIIGYPVYWIELYLLPSKGGHTTPLASVLFLVVAWMTLRSRACTAGWKEGWSRLSRGTRLMIFLGFLAAGILMLAGFYASLLPPHLIQEYDTMNYHITLPRQHLILGSFAHIRWSTADLYFLPLDFALAPYWLVTALPNKFPQFLFVLGMIAVAFRLARRISGGDLRAGILAAFGVLGSHHIGIQVGTAMLDITLCYLVLAALDSFLDGNPVLAAVELAFYVWAKSFLPLQLILIILGVGAIVVLARRAGFRISWGFSGPEPDARVPERAKRMILVLLLVSIPVGGPFLAKSLYYTGTPLFPFQPGMVKLHPQVNSDTVAWRSILDRAEKVRSVRDNYGSGRSPREFLRHLWLISVPEKGVNNRYDYPVGLMYLVFLGPFVFGLVRSWRDRRLPLLPLFAVVYWAIWWVGSQQTRFLLIPVAVMGIAVLSWPELKARLLLPVMLLALALTTLSVVRAHRMDFGRWGVEVLREEDRALLERSKHVKAGKTVVLNDFDAAYADFPVDVRENDFVFVLEY